MGAQEFLQRVEQTGMVSQPLLEELRTRINESKRDIRVEILAKLLVDRDELTPAQARKLVALANEDELATPPPAPPEPPRSEPELTLVEDEELAVSQDETARNTVAENEELLLLADDDDEELGLLEEADEGEPALQEPGVGELDLLLEEPEAILIEDDPHLELAEAELDVPAATSPPPPPTTPPVDIAAELDDIFRDPAIAAAEAPAGARLPRRNRGLKGIWNDLFGKKQPRKNRWDSPLILLGGGALILLLLAGVGFVVLFRSESGDELFQAADDAYRSGSYSQAIISYDKFAASYPQHEKASLARVRIELAKLRQLTEGTKDWEAASLTARANLPGIVEETAFSEARLELAGLLPDITTGLVARARAAEDITAKKELIDLATKSLELVNNSVYLPTSVRRSQDARIEYIESDIQVVIRDIQRDEQLQATVADITTAANAGRIAQAYTLRDRLLKSYPILEDHSSLNAVLSLVTSKEREAVRVTPGAQKSVAEDHPSPSLVRVILSDQRGQPADGIDGQILGVLIRGAVYGIDAAQGKVLWRRFVGYETDVFPQAMNTGPRSDFLLVDAMHGEVLRVEGETGKLVWRLVCPRPIAPIRIMAGRALIACGKQTESALVDVDIETGNVRRQIQFPVGCATVPTVNIARKEVIQLGTHSSLYVLDANSLQCKSVIPLGHTRQSVHVGPVTFGKHLLVCENNGTDGSRLHVFTAVEQGNWVREREPVRMHGQVFATPSVDERRVLVMTDTGEIHIFEAPLDQGPLREIAHHPSGNNTQGQSFALLQRSSLWLGHHALTRYELQATRGQLIPKWVRHTDDRFMGPIQRRGAYLFQVRRRAGMLGATISAARISSSAEDGETVWETDVGVPCSIVVNDKGIAHAMTANGALFPIDRIAVRNGTTSRRAARIDPRLLPKALAQQIPVSTNQIVFASPPPVRQMVRADLTTQELKLVPLRLDEVTAELVNFHDSILAACAAGPIQLVGVSSGQPRMSPFMPRIEPGARIDWLRPAPLEDPQQFVAAERSGRLYRVAINRDGTMLEMLKENHLDGEFASGLTSLGRVVYAVLRGDSGGPDVVTVIEPEDLTAGAQTALGDGLAWGPRRAGSSVFVADAAGTVYCFDDSGGLRWKVTQIGPLAGDPLALNDGKDGFIFASKHGLLTVVDQNGQVRVRTDMSEPLGSGPVTYGGRLLLAGWDGTLYFTDVPQ